MNRRAIKSVLNKKFNELLASIDDEEIRNAVSQNSIITGGAIVSLLTGEEVHDFDIYLKDFETVKSVAEYYVNRFNDTHDTEALVRISDDNRVSIFIKSEGVAGNTDPDEPVDQASDTDTEQKESKPRYRPVFLSSNAITLSDKVQIIIRFYGEPQDIHANYDFVHCTSYWTSWNNTLFLNPLALESIITKELKYVGSLYPVASIARVRKFLERGWYINAGQLLKMTLQASELDLTDPDVLEDQLTGVDVAYFYSVIDQVKQRTEDDPEFTFNANYLCTIIDKIF